MFDTLSPHLSMLMLLAGFQIKHMICDFPLQTREMLQQKGDYGNRWGILHASIHGAATLILLLYFAIPFKLIAICVIAESLFHYHLDWAKERLAQKLNVRTTDKAFWMLLGLDTMLHQLSYIVIVAFVWPI